MIHSFLCWWLGRQMWALQRVGTKASSEQGHSFSVFLWILLVLSLELVSLKLAGHRTVRRHRDSSAPGQGSAPPPARSLGDRLFPSPVWGLLTV